MRGVDDEHVDTGFDQRAGTLPRIVTDADGRTHTQSPLRILRRLRELDPLLDVLDGDQTAQPPFAVDDGQLLDVLDVALEVAVA